MVGLLFCQLHFRFSYQVQYFLFLEAIIGYYTRTRKIAEIFRSIKSRNKLRIVSGRGRWHVIINERRSQTVGNI